MTNKKFFTRGLILALVFTMLMSMGVSAASHTVNNWTDYKVKVGSDIIKQEEKIVITFGDGGIFSREYPARLIIVEEFNKVIKGLPKHFGELNIKEEETTHILDIPSKRVTHGIKYNIGKAGFDVLNPILDNEYDKIRSRVTDYEKIKASYDYINGGLSDVEGEGIPAIKEVFTKGDHGHAFLFSMMMTELGYDNDIATSTDENSPSHKWNLVKIQGKWYHVDGSLEIPGEDKKFLIALANGWNISDHSGKILSEASYSGDPEKLQIEYEMELIEEEIIETSKEIGAILEDTHQAISMEQIKETKGKLEIIEKQVKTYQEKKNVLKTKADKINDGLLGSAFDRLQSIIEGLSKGIKGESDLPDINGIIPKKISIINKTVTTAVETFQKDNISIVKEALSIIGDKELEDGDLKDRIDDVERIINAIEAVIKAEETKLEEDMDRADELIHSISDGGLKEILEQRMASLRDQIKASKAEQDAIIGRVDTLKGEIEEIPENQSMLEGIENIEDAFKTTEKEVSKIEDADVKKAQQDRVNEIKLAIAAIKAVDNAETPPLKTTNVSLASNAIKKLNKDYWQIDEEDAGIIKELENRLGVVEKKIAASALETNAIKAVEKAEKTMKAADIALAEESVRLFENSGTDQDLKIQLDNRLAAVVGINNMENSLADYLLEHSLDNRARLDPAIGNASFAIDIIKGYQIDNVVERYTIRLKVARNTRTAIDKIILAGQATSDEGIKAAEEAIAMISDDKIRKKLENKLIDISSEEGAKKQINKAKTSIKSVKDMAKDGDLLSDIIKEAEEAVKAAEAEIKKIKDKDAKIPYQNEIKEIKLAIAAMKALDKAETPPLKTTNVTSASKAIEKLSEDYWEISGQDTIIKKLNMRLAKIEKELAELGLKANAIKAVEKAEKSMKNIDIALANDAIKSIKDKVSEETIKELEYRIAAIAAMNNMENSLVKCLGEYSQDNSKKLEAAIGQANGAVEKINIPSLEIKYTNRLIVVEKIKDAMDKIQAVEDAIVAEESEVKEEAIIDAIKVAEEAIGQVSDSKIKKELEVKLNDIITQRDIKDKIAVVEKLITDAKDSVKKEMDLYKNLDDVKKAEDEVKKLPNISQKKGFQDIIKELNNVIKAKQVLQVAEAKLVNGNITSKDVVSAEKAISNLNIEYREYKSEAENIKSLDTRLIELRSGLENLEAGIGEKAVEIAEESALYDNKSLSKDIADAKKAVDIVSNKAEYGKVNLNARIRALENYVSTIKVLESAEKTRNEKNLSLATIALKDFEKIIGNVSGDTKEGVYDKLQEKIDGRIQAIERYLKGENGKVENARKKVEEIEAAMANIETPDPDTTSIREAQTFVDMVTDKTIRDGLQKRIDAIQIAKDAKIAVTRAEAYPTEKSVKDAETALNKVDGRYADIIENLGGRIADLRNQLDISKKVAEATKLVQKAIETRNGPDLSAAQFAVDPLKNLAPATYDSLNKILDDLRNSIENEAGDQITAQKDANDALYGEEDVEEGKEREIGAFARIDKINTAIINIIAGEEDEAKHIQDVYVMIDGARAQIMNADAAVRRLKDQKQLAAEVNGARAELNLSEDNLHVKEAVRLTTLASDSVNKAKDEEAKSKTRLDIAAARRAIDKITHINNKAIKTTILNTLNAIESKLTSDNDQELIDIAIEAVNDAADLLTKAVREDKVIERQEDIDKSIFSAKMAIGWISDNNKAAKDTLTGFLNDIESMYKAEKDGILNEERIKNAEEAVKKAEDKKGSDELESYIRSARLRVKMIKNDGPETEVIINDLNMRLYILEGKSGGGSGDKPGDKPGGNKPGDKPGGGSNTNKPPTKPLPSKDRFTGVTQPKWGITKELNKKAPVVNLPKKR